jgi:hypothetical protein
MSLHIYSMFVLSCVGSGLATGLITRPIVQPAVYKSRDSRLILMGNRPEGLIEKVEAEEEEEEEEE